MRTRTTTQESLEKARRELVSGRSTDAAAWRALIENTLSTALGEMDHQGFAETIQFMSHFFDAEGRLDEALREVEHAIKIAETRPSAVGLLAALRASFLTAVGRDTEAAASLDMTEHLLSQAHTVPTPRWPVMAETVRLRLLLPPSDRLPHLLALGNAPETQADYLVLLSWYIPYLAASGDRTEARPLTRLGGVVANNLNHRWRISDFDAFERWQSTVDGALPRAPVERSVSAQAHWRQATLWLWSVSLRRDLSELPAAIERLKAAHARQGAADVGPVEAWESWTRVVVGDRAGLTGIHPPHTVNLLNLGTWLAAAHCVALAGNRDDARIWLPWVRKLGADGIETSMEWPVSRQRIEGLLWLRSGKKARGRVVLRQAAAWAESAGYVTERAVAAIGTEEATSLLQAGSAAQSAGDLESERTTLIDLGIDPLLDIQSVQSAALAGSSQPEPILTAREVEALRLLAEDLTYREIGLELGISWQTVRTMAHHIYAKLGARGKHDAARTGRDLGLL